MKPTISNTKRTWLRRALASRMRSNFVIPAVGAGLMMGMAALPGYAVQNVTDPGSLSAAVDTANADLNNPADNIALSNNITLTGTDHFGTAAGNDLLNSGITITGNTLTFANTITINPSVGNTVAVGTILDGAGGIIKTGDGNLDLQSANTYAGGTTLQGGKIQIDNDLSLGAGGLTVNNGNNGQGLDYNGNLNVANSITLTNDLTANVGTGFLATQNGAIGGAGNLTKTGDGELDLATANTYGGNTRLSAGTLGLLNSASLGTTGSLTTAANTTVNYGNGVNIGNQFDLEGNLTANVAAGTATQTGAVNNATGFTGSLTKEGVGELILNSANGYSGGTTFDNGILTLNNSSSLGSGLVTVVNNGNNKTLNYADGIDVQNNISNDGQLNVFVNSGTATQTGVISGGGASILAKNGAGTLVLNGNNTYGGGTFLSGGTISITNNNSLGASTLIVLGGGTILNYNNTAGDLSITNSIVLADNLTTSVDSGTATQTGDITGAFGITKTGAGTLVLDGAKTNAGDDHLAAGTISINNNNSISNGTGHLVVDAGSNGQTLDYNNSGGNLTIANQIDLNADLTTNVDSGTATQTGDITGGFGITKTGAGILVLDGAKANTGDDHLAAGTISINNNNSISNGTGHLVVDAGSNGQTLDYNNSGGNLTIANQIDLNADLTTNVNSGIATQNGVIGDGGNGFGITKTGAGTLVLNNTNTYTGGTTLDNGTLQLTQNGSLGTGALDVANNGNSKKVIYNNGIAISNDIQLEDLPSTTSLEVTNPGETATQTGVISGNGGFTKTGAGTLVLNSANNYSGGTTLDNGALTLNFSDSLGTGDLTVDNSLNAKQLNYADGIDVQNKINLQNGGANPLVVNVATGAATQTGVISGNGAIDKYGVGQLSLNGVNTFNGNTTLEEGTLSLGTDTALGVNTNTLFIGNSVPLSSKTVDYQNGVNIANNMVINDPNGVTLQALAGVSAIQSGHISGVAGITKTGTGKLELNAINSYNGNTNLVDGTLSLGNNFALGSSDVHVKDNGSATNAILDYKNNVVIANSIFLEDNVDMNVDGNDTATQHGPVSEIGGSFGVTKTGTGTLLLNNTNTYSGGTILDNGTISLGDNSALGTGDVTVNANANTKTLDYTDGKSIANNILLNGDLNLNQDGGSATQTGDITGAGGITKTGDGTVILTSINNTYGGNTSVDAGTLENQGTITASNVTANNGGTFHNTGTVNNGTTAETGGTVNNDGLAGSGTADGGTYNNSATGIVGSASITNQGGTFNNDGLVAGDATVQAGTFNNNNGTGTIGGDANIQGGTFNNDGGAIGGNANVSGGVFNGLGGSVAGSIVTSGTGTGNVGLPSISGDGANYSETLSVGTPGNPADGVQNTTTFSVGGGTIGASGTPANGNVVANTLIYVGTGNAVANTGSGTFAVGNGSIYGNDNNVANVVTGGPISQTGTGKIIVGGADIHGDGNTVLSSVEDVSGTAGNVSGNFNTLHSSNNHSTENFGHVVITGAMHGQFGANDVSLAAPSNNNSDTVTVNGIEVDNTGGLGASVQIGGDPTVTHEIHGNHNYYDVVINSAGGGAAAIALTNGATATLSGGTNRLYGTDNHFINTVNGDITADNSTLNLNAGVISADSVVDVNNKSGNDITGNVTLTNGSTVNITGQITAADNTGSNQSSNNISGALSLTDSYAAVMGHNNTMGGGVALNASEMDIYSPTAAGAPINTILYNQSGLSNLENSVGSNASPVNVSVNDGALVIGAQATTPGTLNTITDAVEQQITNSNNNTITNTVHGTLTDLNNGGAAVEASLLNIQGNTNHVNNVLSQSNFALSNDTELDQDAGMTVDGHDNQINNSITGNVTLASGAEFNQEDDPAHGNMYLVATNGSANNSINNTLKGTLIIGAGSSASQGNGVLIATGGSHDNSINNTIDGAVTINAGGELEQVGSTIGADGANNLTNNTITQGVTVNGGLLTQQGGIVGAGFSASDGNGNAATNRIDGGVTVENGGDFLINGERNIVTGGVLDQSSNGTHIGGADVSVTGATINNESTADHTVNSGGHLHIGTNDVAVDATQDITGSSNHIYNHVIGDSSLGIGGNITVDGAGSVLGLGDGLTDSNPLTIGGSDNHIYNEVSSAFTADHLAPQLNTVTGGGEVLLGGRTITSNGTGNTVDNTITQDVKLGANSGDSGFLELAGGTNTGTNNATVNNTVTGAVEANGTSGVLLQGSDGANNVVNKITGAVTLNNNSILVAADGGAAGNGNVVTGGITLNGSGEALDNIAVGVGSFDTGIGNIENNSLNADIHFQNHQSVVVIGSQLGGAGNGANAVTNDHYGIIDNTVADEGGAVLIGGQIVTASNNGLTTNNNSIENTQHDAITLSGSNANVLLSGEIDENNAAGSGTNEIDNTVDNDVTVTDGAVTLAGVINSNTPASINSITNTISGGVTISGKDDTSGGQLNLLGDLDGVNNNTVTNNIGGTATLNNKSQLTVIGDNNTINGGLNMNDSTTSTIGGNSTATAADVSNSLKVNGAGVVVSGNPDSYHDADGDTNFDAGDYGQNATTHDYATDSGHVLVGGGANTATAHSITNKLDASVTLNGDAGTHFDGTNDYFNSGGKLVVGGAANALNTNGAVTNEVTGTVDLHGGSRLYIGGDTISGDGTGTVLNIVDGTVNADGNSYISIVGNHEPDDVAGSTLSNVLGDQLNTYGNVITNVSGDNNIVANGVNLHGNSELQLSALSAWSDEDASNQLNGSVTLYDHSNLILGNAPAAGSSMVGNNTIFGDVTTDPASDGSIKVLSGGAGGTHNADGTNEITGKLTLNATNKFEVNFTTQSVVPTPPATAIVDAVATGVKVDGTSDLNGATVVVHDLDASNLANGHPDFTLGRTQTLVQGVIADTDANSVIGFNKDVTLEVQDGSGVETTYDQANSALKLQAFVKEDNSSAYMRWLTDFTTVAKTGNEKAVGQYLDDLVKKSDDDGIQNTAATNDLSDTLNYLLNRGPGALNGVTGDTYSAFDMVGYQNMSHFLNSIATHARQSHDNDWTQNFALNAQNGLSGTGAQMSLVRQLLDSHPTMRLNANGNNGYSNDNALWGEVSGHWLRNDADGSLGSPDWTQNTRNINIGYQGGGDSFSWGITGGYHDGNIDFSNRSADGDNDGWNLGWNGLWKSKSNTYVSAALAYGNESNSLTRNDGLGTNKSDFDAKSYAAMLEIGKRVDKKTYNFTPYASLTGIKTKRDGVTESGTGAGLTVDGESNNYLTSALGIRIGRDYLDANGEKRGGVMLGASWQHQFSNTDLPVTSSIGGIGGFTSYGTPLSSNSIGVQLGAYGRLSRNIYGFVNYSGNFGGNQKVNSIAAGLQYGF